MKDYADSPNGMLEEIADLRSGLEALSAKYDTLATRYELSVRILESAWTELELQESFGSVATGAEAMSVSLPDKIRRYVDSSLVVPGSSGGFKGFKLPALIAGHDVAFHRSSRSSIDTSIACVKIHRRGSHDGASFFSVGEAKLLAATISRAAAEAAREA